MTRKEEREQAKLKYAKENPIYEWDKCEEEYFPNKEEVSKIFETGAEWADKTMIDKACEWLKEFIQRENDYLVSDAYIFSQIKEFRKAMEE